MRLQAMDQFVSTNASNKYDLFLNRNDAERLICMNSYNGIHSLRLFNEF